MKLGLFYARSHVANVPKFFAGTSEVERKPVTPRRRLRHIREQLKIKLEIEIIIIWCDQQLRIALLSRHSLANKQSLLGQLRQRTETKEKMCDDNWYRRQEDYCRTSCLEACKRTDQVLY